MPIELSACRSSTKLECSDPPQNFCTTRGTDPLKLGLLPHMKCFSLTCFVYVQQKSMSTRGLLKRVAVQVNPVQLMTPPIIGIIYEIKGGHITGWKYWQKVHHPSFIQHEGSLETFWNVFWPMFPTPDLGQIVMEIHTCTKFLRHQQYIDFCSGDLRVSIISGRGRCAAGAHFINKFLDLIEILLEIILPNSIPGYQWLQIFTQAMAVVLSYNVEKNSKDCSCYWIWI